MSLRPRKMSARQEVMLAKIKNARMVKLERELSIREDIEAELRERLKQYDDVLLAAIQDAVDAGVSKAAIMRAYGTKDYRTVQNYIERVQERNSIVEALTPQRFAYQGVNGRGEIIVADIITGDVGRLYIGSWKNDWEHNLYGVRDGQKWLEVPELERFVEDVEKGKIVPLLEIERLEKPIRERIAGSGRETPDIMVSDWD